MTRTEHPAAAPVGGGRSAVFVYPNELAGLFINEMKESNGFGLSTSVKLVRIGLEKSSYKNAIETQCSRFSPKPFCCITFSEN